LRQRASVTAMVKTLVKGSCRHANLFFQAYFRSPEL